MPHVLDPRGGVVADDHGGALARAVVGDRHVQGGHPVLVHRVLHQLTHEVLSGAVGIEGTEAFGVGDEDV